MPIGGDLSHNKCDNCDSFLVWNEFGNSRSDESQLEEVCEECEVNKLSSRAELGTRVHNFLEKLILKQKRYKMNKSTDYYIKMIANYINDQSRDYRHDMLVHLFGRIYKKESNNAEIPSISKEWSRVIKAIEIEEL